MNRNSNLRQETPEPIASEKERVLSIGPRRVKVNSVTAKVLEDINFLRDRIDKIKRLNSPNKTILSTYEEMLESRESILEWLKKLER